MAGKRGRRALALDSKSPPACHWHRAAIPGRKPHNANDATSRGARTARTSMAGLAGVRKTDPVACPKSILSRLVHQWPMHQPRSLDSILEFRQEISRASVALGRYRSSLDIGIPVLLIDEPLSGALPLEPIFAVGDPALERTLVLNSLLRRCHCFLSVRHRAANLHIGGVSRRPHREHVRQLAIESALMVAPVAQPHQLPT